MIAIQKRDGVPTVLVGDATDGYKPLDGDGWDDVVAEGLGDFDGNPIVPVEASPIETDFSGNAQRAIRLIRELSDRNDDATYRAAVKEIIQTVC